jgi:hypothetical protein
MVESRPGKVNLGSFQTPFSPPKQGVPAPDGIKVKNGSRTMPQQRKPPQLWEKKRCAVKRKRTDKNEKAR